jgi:hypothetical protein
MKSHIPSDTQSVITSAATSSITETNASDTVPKASPSTVAPKSSFNENATYIEDTSIEDVFNFLNQPKPTSTPPHKNPKMTYNYTTSLDADVKRLRLNIIRFRYARTHDQTSLQLFKSFMLTVKKADPNLQILLIDSTKQHYTALTSERQIEILTQTHLRLYFSPFHNSPQFSLSGYVHISTVRSLDELMSHQEVDQWLDFYRYTIQPCPSQDKESPWWELSALVVYLFSAKTY